MSGNIRRRVRAYTPSGGSPSRQDTSDFAMTLRRLSAAAVLPNETGQKTAAAMLASLQNLSYRLRREGEPPDGWQPNKHLVFLRGLEDDIQSAGGHSCIKCASIGKNIHDLKQLIQLFVLFLRQLKILLNCFVNFTAHSPHNPVIHSGREPVNNQVKEAEGGDGSGGTDRKQSQGLHV